MLVNVRQLREGHNPVSFRVEGEALSAILQEIDELYGPTHDLQLEWDLQRYGETTTVTGDLQLALTFDCARCGNACQENFAYPVRWTLLPAASLNTGNPEEDVELTSDDLDVSFLDTSDVDLVEIVREVLLLEVPSCPHCPLDACEATAYLPAPTEEPDEQAPIDPRWAALAGRKIHRGDGQDDA